MRKIKQFNSVMLFGILLLAYAVVFLYIFLFKNVSPFALFSPDRVWIRSANFIPFYTIKNYLLYSENSLIAASNVLGNIILFMPLGIYLQLLLKNKKVWLSMLIVLATTLFVELFQFVFAVGAVDVDDVILNVLGGLIGILLYKGLYALLRDEEKVRVAIVIAGIIAVLIPVLLSFGYGLKWRIGWLV